MKAAYCHEIKLIIIFIFRLRERELQLGSDLSIASREINRLRVEIKRQASYKDSWDSDWDED